MIDLGLSEEQTQLQGSFRALFDREGGPVLVREVEPLGFSPRLWHQATALGAADMAVPEECGGGGAALLDAALVAEVAGEHLAPVPLIETTVANRLLARLGGPASDVLREGLARSAITTIALSAPVDGVLRWVPAGAVADRVLAFDGSRVVVSAGTAPGRAEPNLGCFPLAHRGLTAVDVLADGSAAATDWQRAIDEWRVLVAAWLFGAGRRSLDMALGYTVERKAFGVPVASYQAVAHRLADLATALDGSQLLHRKAAWAADRDSPRRRELALMAAAFAVESSEMAAADALHFHGGYGFMLEYDIQLYLRRIKALALLNGNPAGELQILADELWGASVAGRPG